MNIKVGDIVTDVLGQKWLVFETSDKYIYGADLYTQEVGTALLITDIASVEEKPENVEYMFIKKRERTQREYGIK
jgi:hypothetical protein